jgi:nitrogen fixation NifU-like protein
MTEALYNAEIKRLAATPGQRLEGARSATRDNPLCGDRVTIDVAVEGDRIAALGHAVKGCLLCKAAAQALAETLPGLTPAQAQEMAEIFARMLAEDGPAPAPLFERFRPVRPYLNRHACVSLPFQALGEALEG